MSYGEFLKNAALARVKVKSSPSFTGYTPGPARPILLQEGDSLTVKGASATGTVQRLDTSGNVLQTWTISGNGSISTGAFSGTQQFLITCTAGSIDATVGDVALNAVLASSLTNTASIIGDSYAANNYSQASNNFFSTQTSGILVTADELLGGVFDINQNVAVGGKTTAQILVEQLPAVLAQRNRYVYVSTGYNDLYGALTTGVDTAALVIQLLQALIANGQVPIWHTIGARSFQNAAAVTEHLTCNAILRDFALTNSCGIFFDLFALTVDPTTGPGALTVRAGWTLDGVNHWNLLGAYYAAKVLAARLKPLLPLPNQLPAGSEDNTTAPKYNLLKNPIFFGVAGAGGAGVTGSIPDNWVVDWTTRTGSATVTVSVVDITDPDTGLVVAKGLQAAITSGAAAAGDVLRIRQDDGVTTILAGQQFSAAGRVSLVNPSLVNIVSLRAQANSNESTWAGMNAAKSGSGTNPNYPESTTMVRRTRKIPALVNGTMTLFEVRVTFTGAASSGAYILSQPRMRKY